MLDQLIRPLTDCEWLLDCCYSANIVGDCDNSELVVAGDQVGYSDAARGVVRRVDVWHHSHHKIIFSAKQRERGKKIVKDNHAKKTVKKSWRVEEAEGGREKGRGQYYGLACHVALPTHL